MSSAPTAAMLDLDNYEHIIDAAAICVRDMLAAAAGVRILATSREDRLRAEGEIGSIAFRLEAARRSSRGLWPRRLSAFPAIELCVERAAANPQCVSLDRRKRAASPRFAASSTAWRWPSNSLRRASTPSRSARSLPASMTGSVCSEGRRDAPGTPSVPVRAAGLEP